MKRAIFLTVAMLLFCLVSISSAQEEGVGECPALVEQALQAAGEMCGQLRRNTVCYGSNNIMALDSTDARLIDFVEVGDRTAIEKVAQLATAGMDVESEIWGVALLALQANLPDTLPGQNVIFVVYGDSQLTADGESGDAFSAPMQAFSLTTGVGDPLCKEAPNDGVLIQSPGGTTVNFLINGIEVEVGSTALSRGACRGDFRRGAARG
jgi:hypothetical protein